MDKEKAIELLKQYLAEIPELRKLSFDDQAYKLWRDRINVVLENAFGKDSDEYKKLNPPINIIFIVNSDEEKQRHY